MSAGFSRGLSADLWTRMEALGNVARQERALQPHVTLARKVQTLPELAAPKPLRMAGGWVCPDRVDQR